MLPGSYDVLSVDQTAPLLLLIAGVQQCNTLMNIYSNNHPGLANVKDQLVLDPLHRLWI